MSVRRRALLIAVAAAAVVVALVVSVLVSGGDAPAPEAEPTPTPTPTETPTVDLADLDTTTIAVTRDTFCDRVVPEAVEDALGAAPTAATEYADGESAQITGRVRDIAHEFSCSWSTAEAGARAWVFSPPVTRRAATALVGAARREDGCRPVSGAPDFGSPTLALTCRTSRGVVASYRGLFGDAWLTCTLADRSAPAADVADRAERWCTAVLAAAAG